MPEHPVSRRAMIHGGADRPAGERMVPAIPRRAPVDVRWCCWHRWTPHVHPDGSESHVDYDCLNCGSETEAGSWPEDGFWPIRHWLALRIFPYGRAVRKRGYE